jgi:hypothetical protein
MFPVFFGFLQQKNKSQIKKKPVLFSNVKGNRI